MQTTMSFRIQSPLPEGTESSQFPSSPLPESIGRCLSLSRKQGHIEKAFHTLNELRRYVIKKKYF